jgi:nucleotide-binding universal stress UspA family protein
MGISEALQAELLAPGYPFDKILVPLDGSGSAESAFPVIRTLCRQHPSKIVLARVIEPDLTGSGSAQDSLSLAEVYLKQAASTLRGPGVRAKTVTRMGSVPETLLGVASEEEASLLLLSTHGRLTSENLPFGSVAGQLLRASPLPILAVPAHVRARRDQGAEPEARPIRSILVLTAGEKPREGILPVAVDFAVSFGADLAILLELVPTWGTGRGEAELRVEAEERQATLAHSFESEQISTMRLIHQGDPLSRTLEVAEEQKADVIAINTRGPDRDAVNPLAERILKISPVPVLLSRGR